MHAKVMVYGPTSSEELDAVLDQFSDLWGRLVSYGHVELGPDLFKGIKDPSRPIIICSRDGLEEFDYKELLACNLIVEEEDGTFTLLDRTTPHIWFKEWEVGSDTFDPLPSKSQPEQTLYSMRKDDVDWNIVIDESFSDLVSAISGDASMTNHLRAYCGNVVVFPVDGGYMQVMPFTPDGYNLRDEDRILLQLIKSLPDDTIVTLVDMNL